MSDVYFNRVKESTTTTGTGAISMGGAVTGYHAFSSVFATGNVVRYSIVSADGSQWEVGKGTLTSGSPWTMSRDVVEESTNANALVNFSAGTKYVWCELPATQAALIQTAVQNSRQVLTGNGLFGGSDLSADRTLGISTPINPMGRLTLSTGVPVMTATVSGASTIYYTPYIGQWCPIYDGSKFVMTDLGGELSQALSDTTKSPAASVQDTCYDLFVWNDSGTVRCTRGPGWKTSVTGTAASVAPVASPGVVNWTAHGLREGSPVVFTTTGALPTGLVAGTTYYVIPKDANSFWVATSMANVVALTKINFTGSTSGNTTVTNGDTARGTGAGTSELQQINGVWTNKNAITNGPAANRGTYVGTIRTNPSNTVDFILGGAASGGTAGVLYCWNYYNRVLVQATCTDTGTSYTYSSTTPRASRASATNRVSFVVGLVEDTPLANVPGVSMTSVATAGAFGSSGISLINTTTSLGGTVLNYTNAAAAMLTTEAVLSIQVAALGENFFSLIESGDGSHNTTYNSPSAAQTIQLLLPM